MVVNKSRQTLVNVNSRKIVVRSIVTFPFGYETKQFTEPSLGDQVSFRICGIALPALC